MKNIVLAGGTGFLGQCIIDHHKSDSKISVLTRGATRNVNNVHYLNWDGKTLGNWSTALENADVLINLNGKSVDCRYTQKNMDLIYSTRLDSTEVLGKAIQQCKIPPKLWINSSSATIYRHSLDKSMDEETGEFGTGFSVDVCKKWEDVFNSFHLQDTRKVAIRTGIVLGKNGGALSPLKTLAQLGLGGKQGKGNQFFSWLHEKDFLNILDFVMQNEKIHGAINVSSPNPIPNEEFMMKLRKVYKVRLGIPMPRWLLEIGAVIIRTETELVLKSRKVIPKRLLDEGYKFQFPRIDESLVDLCSN
ncbi:TIGR01777 family oxidoreductase [Algoriphagus litoralis]|uniref:TIGR01777 family oxidoreductase n=1 Tax=Algoriphagus litoralis TaxID=2202829 RepID=UPI000DB93CD9|nr:TIGR01777 family oxidoreductase [Algoriphagus litoralis]